MYEQRVWSIDIEERCNEALSIDTLVSTLLLASFRSLPYHGLAQRSQLALTLLILHLCGKYGCLDWQGLLIGRWKVRVDATRIKDLRIHLLHF